ncbi:MAG TPA: hypothetical protein VFE62_28900 [Gemmataceae bacterium]|nr:hypothetical protein [Gemmataceae bacterium]
MEHLERIVPLAMLATIAAFVLILIRRGWREDASARPVSMATMLQPKVKPITRVVEPVPVQQVATDPAPVSARQPAPAVAAQPATMPIHGVLALLQRKDTLITGFLLSEILGPPVSQRR